MADPSASLSLLEACWRDLVLGVVQGLTEFLPISSTAHLKVVPELLGWGDPGVSVTAAIQLGSIVAVIAYFRADLSQVLRGISRAFRNGQWREPEARLGFAMVVGTLPILLIGLGIKFAWAQGYEQSPLRSVPSIAIVSIVMALLLALAERVGARCKQLPGVSGRDGLLVGLAQALALIPGSRVPAAPSRRPCLTVGSVLMQPGFPFFWAFPPSPSRVWWSSRMLWPPALATVPCRCWWALVRLQWCRGWRLIGC